MAAAVALLVVGGACRRRRRPRLCPNLWHLVLFLVGAIAMRGAGCTYNDIVDRDIDAKVARTRSRPIPSGQVTRRAGAGSSSSSRRWSASLVLLQFNRFTDPPRHRLARHRRRSIPFMKRITDWPQIGLGLAFSWGALMGWAALFGRLDWAPVLLYAGAILWTIGYDTIYAHQDKEDDALVGVRSTARLFGARTGRSLAAVLRRRDDRCSPRLRARRRRHRRLAGLTLRRRASAPGRSRRSTSTIRTVA